MKIARIENIVGSCVQYKLQKSDKSSTQNRIFLFWKCRPNWQEFSSLFIFLKDSFLHFQSSTVKIWKIIKCEVQKCRNDMHYTI